MTGTVDYHLGEVSERYESSGPGTISTGRGDHGGVSYGTYQLATATGTLDEYLKWSTYGNHFKGLTPNTKAFNEEWRSLASKDSGFAQDQHDFIKATHYDTELATLKRDGLDFSSRGVAVREALWSTSVQYGKLTKHVFEQGLKDKFGANYKLSDLTDKDIVEAVQDYKLAHIDTQFRSSSADVRASVRIRTVSEKEDLFALADGRPLPKRNHVSHFVLRQGSHGEAVRGMQTELHRLGYLDVHGVDGQFGLHTRAAVERFQHDQGLVVDGIVGSATRHQLHAYVQTRQEVAAESNHAPQNTPAPSGFSDPSHLQYEMYTYLQSLLPPRTSQERLHQATAACYQAGIRTPKDLEGIYGGESSLVFLPNSMLAHATSMDLSRPAPSVQESMQQVQTFDQQRAQLQTQTLQHVNLQQRPVPGH